MNDTPNVFISWSGQRSKRAAQVLAGWLLQVIQCAKPWMSDKDIESGTVSIEEIVRNLDDVKVGILCPTPENLAEPWINFEAGALLKTPDAKARVCTYLLAGLDTGSLSED
jgi:hypothetical protein